jgi:hypothetical protein
MLQNDGETTMDPIIALSVILSTLSETKEGPVSSFYLPFMGKLNIDTFNKLMNALVKMDLCKIDNHYVTFIDPAPGSKGAEFLAIVKDAEKKDAELSAALKDAERKAI